MTIDKDKDSVVAARRNRTKIRGFKIQDSTAAAGLKCRSQVAGQVTGQVTGHRPQARSQVRPQATG